LFSLQIKRINKNIKMEKRALTYPLSRMLNTRDTFDRFVVEKEKLVTHITTAMEQEDGSVQASISRREACGG
jgi:hypothetical protein